MSRLQDIKFVAYINNFHLTFKRSHPLLFPLKEENQSIVPLYKAARLKFYVSYVSMWFFIRKFKIVSGGLFSFFAHLAVIKQNRRVCKGFTPSSQRFSN